MKSELFAELREGWPNQPYPLMVDYLDAPTGRVCPAASLYAFGKDYGDRLKTLSVQPGEVVACFPESWIGWVGMMQGCLRRGAVFAPAPMSAGETSDRASWCAAVEAGVILTADEVSRRSSDRRLAPNSIIAGRPAVAVKEPEILEATRPDLVDPMLEKQTPVWLDADLAPLAQALAIVTLLRAEAELHVGLDEVAALSRAEDDHRWFGGAGASSTIASVRAWKRHQEMPQRSSEQRR